MELGDIGDSGDGHGGWGRGWLSGGVCLGEGESVGESRGRVASLIYRPARPEHAKTAGSMCAPTITQSSVMPSRAPPNLTNICSTNFRHRRSLRPHAQSKKFAQRRGCCSALPGVVSMPEHSTSFSQKRPGALRLDAFSSASISNRHPVRGMALVLGKLITIASHLVRWEPCVAESGALYSLNHRTPIGSCQICGEMDGMLITRLVDRRTRVGRHRENVSDHQQ